MRSDSRWWLLPELLALASLALTPVASALAAEPHMMTVTICTGGESRTMQIDLDSGNGKKDRSCPGACHAICTRKRTNERKGDGALPC
jgi:hypothetical protein